MTTEIAAEIEAAEAQKLRNDTPAVPPTKTPMTPKDWATLSISILAFLVSAATAYFNLIRQSDDLSAAFLGSPVLRLPQTENRLRLDTDNSVVVFANAGNRSATILGMHISVFQPETEDGECKGESYFFGASFDAVTLKSGEIATLKITVTPPPGQSADYVALAKRNVGKDEVRVLVCARIRFATPSSDGIREVTVPIQEFLVRDYGMRYLRTNMQGKARVLLKRIQFALW